MKVVKPETHKEPVAAPEETEQPKSVPTPPDPLDELAEALSGLDDAPDILQLEQWKSINGQIHVSSILADDNLYVWKTLKRGEYKSIVSSGAAKDESLFADAVISKCLLYPKPGREWFVKQNAGTIPSLHRQIMYKSGFVSEEMALSLINTI